MIALDLKSNTPLYEQIIEQVKFHVLKGHLKPNDAIPSVRKLALDLAITPGTVAKAYQELERQHIIVTIRGKGTFIAGEMKRKPDEDRLEESRKKLRSVVLEMKMMGLTRSEVLELTKVMYEEMSIC